MNDECLTFIICTYNGAARIGRVLDHIARQQTSPSLSLEVLVVDNASTDGTAEVALRHWREIGASAPLRVVHEPRRGQAYARATGIAAASHEILSFIDDDNWIAADWSARILAHMRAAPRLAAVGAHGVPFFEGPVPAWFGLCQDAYAVGPQRESTSCGRRLTSYYGAGLTVRKSAMASLFDGGFTPMLAGRVGTALGAGDDTELCYALGSAGWELRSDSNLTFQHCLPPHRLTQPYVIGLYRGFGRASVQQDYYNWANRSPDLDPFRMIWRHGLPGLLSSGAKTLLWNWRHLLGRLGRRDDQFFARVSSVYYRNRFISLLGNLPTAPQQIKCILALIGTDPGRRPERDRDRRISFARPGCTTIHAGSRRLLAMMCIASTMTSVVAVIA